MLVSGDFTFGVPKNDLWSALINPYYFGRLIPNIQSIVKLEEDIFKVNGDINISGRDIELSAILKILDKPVSEMISLSITQEGTFGFLSAIVTFYLEETSEDKTKMVYNVDVKIPFFLKTMLGKKVDGLIKEKANEFFQNLNSYLKS